MGTGTISGLLAFKKNGKTDGGLNSWLLIAMQSGLSTLNSFLGINEERGKSLSIV